MKAKLVYEKFKAESDPVSDMNIGVKSMSIEEISKFTSDTFKPFGITIFYRTYENKPNQVAFDLYDNVIQKELPISDFSFITKKGAQDEGFESGGWFIEGFEMDDATYDIDKVVKIVLNELYGNKLQIKTRINNLKNILKYYEENS